MPGFTPYSMYPSLWEAPACPTASWSTSWCDLALDRHHRRSPSRIHRNPLGRVLVISGGWEQVGAAVAEPGQVGSDAELTAHLDLGGQPDHRGRRPRRLDATCSRRRALARRGPNR